MSQKPKRGWIPSKPDPSWRPEPQAGVTRLASLLEEKSHLDIGYTTLAEIVQEFLDDADSQDLGEPPAEGASIVTPRSLDDFKKWIWLWKNSFAAALDEAQCERTEA